MNWKKAAIAMAASALLLSGEASAYDLGKIARETLPASFKYTDIPEEQEVKLFSETYTYHMGQLSILTRRSNKFSYGYIATAELPPAEEESLDLYFREYLSVDEWRGLVRINRALMNENSLLRKGAEEILRGWAQNAVGDLAKNVKISVQDIEPYRKLSSDEAYLYTAGARIIFDADGFIAPFYSRAYFFKEGNHLDVMMLLTPDEGKGPLVYAIDDLAKTAAKEVYTKDERREDLSIMLAKGQQ